MFLGWYDDARQKTPQQKLQEAIERYVVKFGGSPSLCLLNAADVTAVEGIEVKVVEFVRPNHFWVGTEDGPKAVDDGVAPQAA